MGQLIFIAASKDYSSDLINVINADSIDELKEHLLDSIEEAYSLYGARWIIEFDDIKFDDLGLDEDDINNLFDEQLDSSSIVINYLNNK